MITENLEKQHQLQEIIESFSQTSFLNQNSSMDFYKRVKTFKHFAQKSTYTLILKEISSFKKKIELMQIQIKENLITLQQIIPELQNIELIKLIRKICEEERSVRYIQPFYQHKRFLNDQELENLNNKIKEDSSIKKEKILLYQFWEKQLISTKSRIFDQACENIFPKMEEEKVYLIEPKKLSKLILLEMLEIVTSQELQNFYFELKNLNKISEQIYEYRKKTTIFKIILGFLLKLDKGVKLYKQPYQNIIIFCFIFFVNILQIQPYYSASESWNSFIDFLKFDDHNFFVNLGINVFFFYISFCYVQILKHFSRTKKIFSYKKLVISCLIYYGTNIKRNSFVGNWNRKSNFVDFNLEIILIYQRQYDFLKRFHQIKNRNKILQEQKHVMRQLKTKFLPITINNIVNFILILYFNQVCKAFQVHIAEIFLPFIILQFQNFGLFLYFTMILVVQNKRAMNQVNIFEISYLVLKSYSVIIYIGCFIYKMYLTYYFNKGKFHFEELMFVAVMGFLIINCANEFWVKYKSFKKNIRFELKKFTSPLICPICWEIANEGIQTNCQHSFHQECLFNWFDKQDWSLLNCPICRKKFQLIPQNSTIDK